MKNIIPDIIEHLPEFTRWRHDLHAHPELAFDEARTSQFVAEQLQSFGLEVHTGIGGTGVVARLSRVDSGKAIGLRADMDALPMQEQNTFAHKSVYPGRMHGCGHDGHTVMLLAAAQYLAKHQAFNGTVIFIFQPAEEANEKGSGAAAMIKDGLFDRFPMDAVFGMHNWPGLPVGHCSIRNGPVMAAMDLFEVNVTGHGTHGALPHTGIDTVLVCAHIITAWQSIVSRNTDPLDTAVVSATTVQAGDSWNVIPHTAVIRGSVRTFNKATQQRVQQRLQSIAEHIATAMGASVQISYTNSSPANVNDEATAALALQVAEEVVGADKVLKDDAALKLMGSEDFAHLSQQVPGVYLLIGNGDGEGGCMVHEPRYDFNDELIPIGASYWVRLVEMFLA